MAQFVVRNIEDSVKTRLQKRAKRHGTSLENEVRQILRNAVKDEGRSGPGLGTRIAARFAGLGFTEGIKEHKGYKVRLPEFGK